MEKKRLHYLDLAKGILIVFLVLGHTINTIKRAGVTSNEFINDFHVVRQFLWTSFYMPAFYIISGYCSNFNKPFGLFFISNFKSLKIPAVTFGFLSLFLRSFSKQVLIEDSYALTFLYCFIDSGLWFLDALFISKILYWIVLRLFAGDLRICLSCLVLFAIGFSFYNYGVKDHGCAIHALILTFFLFVGQYLKKIEINSKNTIIASLIYIFTILLLLVVGIKIPYVTLKMSLSVSNIPLWFILSISGSVAMIGVCKMISYNRCLCFIGFNSLVFYCTHLLVLGGFKKLFIYTFSTTGYLLTIFFYIIYVLVVLLVCSFFSKAFNTKYLKFMLGKF